MKTFAAAKRLGSEMKYKAVLFDMDGTVLDTLGDLTDAVNHTLRQFAMPERSAAEVASFLGNGAARLISLSVPEATAAELRDRVLAAYSPWYESHCRIKTGPYPGIQDLMTALKAAGVKMAVISNKQHSAVKTLAEQHFPGLLELALGESAKIRRKPCPDAVLAAMDFMGAERGESIYIGDTEVDILTAKNAGIPCAAVSWGFRTRRELTHCGAELIFDTPKELEAFLTQQ